MMSYQTDFCSKSILNPWVVSIFANKFPQKPLYSHPSLYDAVNGAFLLTGYKSFPHVNPRVLGGQFSDVAAT